MTSKSSEIRRDDVQERQHEDLRRKPYYHGTRVEYKIGDLIQPSNQLESEILGSSDRCLFLTHNLDEAVWDAELATGENPGRVYIVEPTGQIEDKAGQAKQQSVSRPTMTLLSHAALRVLGEVTDWPLYHGTRAQLQLGDLIEPGHTSNFGDRQRRANYVYMSRTLDAAMWGAELSAGDGTGRIYVVEPTGPVENDPNLTDKKFRGNPSKSFRSRLPLRVTGEIIGWSGHSPDAIQMMREGLRKLEELGVVAEDD